MAPAKNLLLISVDSLRFDAPACETETRYLARHGRALPARRRTPALDRLAAEGTRFRAVYTSAPYTTNAHAGVFTGLWPWEHGVRTLWSRTPVAAGKPTLAETLKDAGFATLCASGMPHIFHSEAYGLERGFQDRIDLSTHLLNRHFPDMLSWMERHRDGRFFAFWHSTTAHDYLTSAQSEKYRRRGVSDADAFYKDVRRPCRSAMPKRMAAYVDAVNFFDGRELAPLLGLLDASGLAATTLVALFGDHGEPHPHGLTEEEVRVPVFLRGPGVPAGRRDAGPARLMDLHPTALRLLGLPAGEGDAETLALDGEGPAREVYCEYFDEPRGRAPARARLRALRAGPRKVVHDARKGWKAWDLEADWAEKRPRRPSGGFAPLRERLEAIRRADGEVRPASRPPADVVRRLRQLGYLE